MSGTRRAGPSRTRRKRHPQRTRRAPRPRSWQRARRTPGGTRSRRLKNAQAAEKDAKAAAKQAKAELKALRENPVIPAEVLEKLRAEETQRAAETAQQETARRVAEAEKAAQESARRAEQAERQLAAADPEVATFKAWFRAVQDDFARMQETHAQVTDQAKADKLRAAVRALLERERTVWG